VILRDVAGNPVAPRTWMFTTAAAPPPPPPPPDDPDPPAGTFAPAAFAPMHGTVAGGGLAALGAADGSALTLAATTAGTRMATLQATLAGPRGAGPGVVTVLVRHTRACRQEVFALDPAVPAWVRLDTRSAGTAPLRIDAPVPDLARFLPAGTTPTATLQLALRCWTPAGSFTSAYDLVGAGPAAP